MNRQGLCLSGILGTLALFLVLAIVPAAAAPVAAPAVIPANNFSSSDWPQLEKFLFIRWHAKPASVPTQDKSVIGAIAKDDVRGIANAWLGYDFIAPTDGQYLIQLRAACPESGNTLSVMLDGQPLGKALTVPRSRKPEQYSDLTLPVSKLTAGKHTVQVTWLPNEKATVLPLLHYVRICDFPNSRTIRVNAGATEPYIDAAGHVWEADKGFLEGDIVDRGDIVIAKTTMQDLYRTEHYGMSEFNAKLENGYYLVRLHFAETYEEFIDPGIRVFTVEVNGTKLKNIDIIKEVKTVNTALVKEIPVNISDGKLRILFTSIENNAEINAIEVLPFTK